MSEQCLSAHVRLFGALPYGVADLHKKCGYNQGYLATMKINNKYIVESKRVGNDNKNMTTENKSVKL